MRLATMEDKDQVEAICNHPQIRVWTACDGAPTCDAAKYLAAPSFSVLDDRGCFLALNLDPGRYVIHTNLLPSCRGAQAVTACREALGVAFLQTDAVELLTMVPANMPHVKMLARRMGFRHQFDRRAFWPVGGMKFDIGFYRLGIDDWIRSGVHQFEGIAFHQRLHGELGGSPHPTDPVHDCYVGTTAQLIHAGNVEKAVETYNRWARFALYQTIQVLSDHPLRIDIRECVIRIEESQFFREAHHA